MKKKNYFSLCGQIATIAPMEKLLPMIELPSRGSNETIHYPCSDSFTGFY